MAEENRSGLSFDEVDELARKIMRIVCEEMPSPQDPLESTTIRDRLVKDGVKLPDYAMADALVVVEGMTRFYVDPRWRYLGQSPNPDDPDTIEAERTHGSVTIVDIENPELLCDEF